MADPRLDRIPHFDPRSKSFRAVTPRLAAKPPRSYTWRVVAAPVLDQGREGACTGFALAAELAARPVEREGIDNNFAQRLYWQAQGVDRAEGRHYPEGATMLAVAKAGQRAGYFTSYKWAFGLDDLVTTLGYLGPVMLGVAWYESFYDPGADHTLRIGGPVVGGHAILARGVDVRNQRVRLRNSWSEAYGDRGDVWVPFDVLDRLLRDNGEALIPQGRA